MRSTSRNRNDSAWCVAVAAVAIALLASGCDDDRAQTATPTSTPFPYPPVGYRTEVAVPLDEHLRSAAELALDQRSVALEVTNPDKRDVWRANRDKVAPEADRNLVDEPRDPHVVGETGGYLLRAVAAVDVGDGVIEVAVCTYDEPGSWFVYDDGRTEGPTPEQYPYGLTRPRVQWTDRPAADGSTPGGPRWLLVDRGVSLDPNQPRQEKIDVCEPFKPEPFIQKMPDPIQTSSSPTPTK